MLTSKERAYLKSLANNLKPITSVGKEGINQGFIDQLKVILEKHELVKITILNNSMLSSKEAAIKICKLTKSDFVQAIGGKAIIYRKSKEDPQIVLPKR